MFFYAERRTVALVANEEPRRPLYKGCRFTTLLLFADSSFVRSDCTKVHLYRMIPLTTSEREYEQKRGLKSFMQALVATEGFRQLDQGEGVGLTTSGQIAAHISKLGRQAVQLAKNAKSGWGGSTSF